MTELRGDINPFLRPLTSRHDEKVSFKGDERLLRDRPQCRIVVSQERMTPVWTREEK